MTDKITVEVVFALADRQRLVEVSVPDGATVTDAIAASGLPGRFPTFDFEALTKGVWGRVLPGEHVLKEGDRVEIYRDLELDPRQARRQLASIGKTMAESASD